MAACGIAEHNDARRKEVVYLRKAYYQRKRENMERERHHQDLLEQSTGRYTGRQPTTYDLQVENTRYRGMAGTDYRQQNSERYLSQYDKPNNDFIPRTTQRYSNNDYLSQW